MILEGEGGWGYEIYMEREYFLRLLSKSMQRQSDFGGREIFFENSMTPQRINWFVPYR